MAAATPEAVVKKIFSTDKRIKFCAVVDSEGKIEAGGMRPGFRFLEPEAETARIVTRMFLNQAMNQASDQYFGRVNWAIIHREKLVQITFPLPGRKQLQVTTALGYPVSKVAKLGRYVDQLGMKA
ncbi:MAG TPA: hypothetical protein VLU99_07080 [Nitrososphaerales archaeon]|nr:hypothetical protein [Nitrososphaerales archaeon]